MKLEGTIAIHLYPLGGFPGHTHYRYIMYNWLTLHFLSLILDRLVHPSWCETILSLDITVGHGQYVERTEADLLIQPVNR